MPADADFRSFIQKKLSGFQSLCKKPSVRSVYKTGVAEITHYPGMINVIAQDGIYWNIIDSAAQKDIIIQSKGCLSEVLMDFTIKEVVSLMFGLKKDINAWSESVRTYAFGN